MRRLACVLCSHVTGFERMADKLDDVSIVRAMHGLWCRFDALVQEYGMYKVQTMCCLPSIWCFVIKTMLLQTIWHV